MKIIRGKRAMVTGAANGIGRAIALALAAEGADLFLVDIDSDNLSAVAEGARACGAEGSPPVCDLAEPAQVSAAVARVRVWGGLNILINNAGLAYYGPTHLMTDAQWNGIMAGNLLPPGHLVRALQATHL